MTAASIALRERLQKAPLDFISAFSSSDLHVFEKEWRSLRADVDNASASMLLDDEDLALVHSTAILLATWGDAFLKTEDEAAQRTALFIEDVQDVFAHLSISDVDNEAPPPLTLPRHPRLRPGVPSLIPAAYSWILQNIHNPYPSIEVKEHIARGAGRPLRAVTDWFKDVRRYIGWVPMCKNHFHGSRARAVQAAQDVYLRSASLSKLPSDIVPVFEAIRTRLHNMYPLGDDSGDFSDSSDDSVIPSASSSRRYPSNQSSYARSRSSSSTPSLVFSTDDEDSHSLASFVVDDVPVNLGKRKGFDEDNQARPLKRNRSGLVTLPDCPTTDEAPASLALGSSLSPSQPAPSRKRRLSVAATEWEDLTPIPQDWRPLLRVPKRRLSVSDSQPNPKRSCLPPTVGPRKQTVSTPIPIAHQTMPSVDDWFHAFELPDTSLSVELFNWDVVVENNAFLYNSLFDDILQSDDQNSSNVTPLLDACQSLTPLDLGVSSAVDTSVLGISSTFTGLPPTQMQAPMSTLSPGPITATTIAVFDFDAFLSADAELAASQSTQSSSSPSTGLSLNDSIDFFGDLGNHMDSSSTPAPSAFVPNPSIS